MRQAESNLLARSRTTVLQRGWSQLLRVLPVLPYPDVHAQRDLHRL